MKCRDSEGSNLQRVQFREFSQYFLYYEYLAMSLHMLTGRHASFTIDNSAVLNTKPSEVEMFARVRKHISHKWKEFGDHLHAESNLIEVIHKDERDCSGAFRSLCFKWLKEDPDTGDRPRTWRTVLDAMRGCEEVGPAKDVEESLISNPPSPPPTLANRVFSKSEY